MHRLNDEMVYVPGTSTPLSQETAEKMETLAGLAVQMAGSGFSTVFEIHDAWGHKSGFLKHALMGSSMKVVDALLYMTPLEIVKSMEGRAAIQALVDLGAQFQGSPVKIEHAVYQLKKADLLKAVKNVKSDLSKDDAAQESQILTDYLLGVLNLVENDSVYLVPRNLPDVAVAVNNYEHAAKAIAKAIAQTNMEDPLNEHPVVTGLDGTDLMCDNCKHATERADVLCGDCLNEKSEFLLNGSNLHKEPYYGYSLEEGCALCHPEKWKNTYSTCGGHHQSPIDLPSVHGLKTIRQKSNDLFVLLKEKETKGQKFTVINNGNYISLDFNKNAKISIDGGVLDGNWKLDRIIFHTGSEHRLQGKFFPLEMQIMFKQGKKAAGIAVLFKMGKRGGPGYKLIDPVVAALPAVTVKRGEKKPPPNRTHDITDFNFNYTIAGKTFYTYDGSWTEPPCEEGVKWFVQTDVFTASPEQIAAFWMVVPNLIQRNNQNRRIPQPVNGRPIQLILGKRGRFGYNNGSENMLSSAARWVALSAACGGARQSPIDLPLLHDPSMPHPECENRLVLNRPVSTLEEIIRISNNSYTILVDMSNFGSVLNGGPLEGDYILQHIEFHMGSEHTIDGLHFPLEMNIVFKRPDGLKAIIAVLYRKGDPSFFLDPIYHRIQDIERPDSYVDVDDFDFDFSVGKKTFYTYQGSLVQPPCTEGVTWFVQTDIETVSQHQLDEFSRVMNGIDSRGHENRRPINPANGRVISLTGHDWKCT